MIVSPWIISHELLARLLEHMIWNHYGWVDLLSSHRIESTKHTEVFLYHRLFISVSTLYDDRILHYVIGYRTF